MVAEENWTLGWGKGNKVGKRKAEEEANHPNLVDTEHRLIYEYEFVDQVAH